MLDAVTLASAAAVGAIFSPDFKGLYIRAVLRLAKPWLPEPPAAPPNKTSVDDVARAIEKRILPQVLNQIRDLEKRLDEKLAAQPEAEKEAWSWKKDPTVFKVARDVAGALVNMSMKKADAEATVNAVFDAIGKPGITFEEAFAQAMRMKK